MADVSRAKFMQKLKGRSKGAWNKVRTTEAKARGRTLPGGIKNGIASLSSFKLGETVKGDPFVTITGIVVDPPECEGMRATSMFFLNENEYATFEQNYEVFCSGLQLLGIETARISEDDILKALEDRCKEAPQYLFNTVEQRNGNGVNVYIQGLVEDDNSAPRAPAGNRQPPSRRPPAQTQQDATDETPQWDVGTEVVVDYDGQEFSGVITECLDNGCNVHFEDDTDDFVEFDRLVIREPDQGGDAEAELGSWQEGERCQVDYDGTLYGGTIQSIDGETATIDFDDGTQSQHELSELQPEEPAPAGDEWVPDVDTVYGYEDKGKVKAFVCTKVYDDGTCDLKEEKNPRNVKKKVPNADLVEAP